MSPRHTVSRSAVELIKAFEGFRSRAARLDDGRWTIGYGHTATAREGAQVSEADAEALLLYDLIHAAHAVNEHVHAPLTQNQFDALVAFVFNIGEQNFRGSITLRRLNEGRPLEAALAMELWRRSDVEGERIIVDALVRRRAAETALFLRPMEGWMPAPTPVLQPKMDYDAVGFMPLKAPIAARSQLAGERAFAERQPETPFEPPEPPSASEAAAQAVIDRLGAILAESEAVPSEGIAKDAVEAPLDAPAPTMVPMRDAAITQKEAEAAAAVKALPGARRPRRRAIHPLVYLLLAAAGVGLLALASAWELRPHGWPVIGFPPRTAGLAVGAVGIVCFSVAAYFLLDELGQPR